MMRLVTTIALLTLALSIPNFQLPTPRHPLLGVGNWELGVVSAQTPGTAPPAPADVAAPPADAVKSASGLASKVVTPGTGDETPLPTDVVTVHYTGWTTDGKMFDSSRTRGTPSMFPLNRVIPGWRECVQLMVTGETRRCWIPQELAYKGQVPPTEIRIHSESHALAANHAATLSRGSFHSGICQYALRTLSA